MTWKGRPLAQGTALTHRRTHPHGTARHWADATPSLSGSRFRLPGTFEGGPISKGSGTCVQIPEPQIPGGTLQTQPTFPYRCKERGSDRLYGIQEGSHARDTSARKANPISGAEGPRSTPNLTPHR
jgi:hypothetical protein